MRAASAKTPGSGAGPTLRSSIRYEVIDDSTAYLDVDRWWGFSESEITAYVDSVFADIRSRGIETLIIDERGNGGENDRLARPLLDYLTDAPYEYYGNEMRKLSPAYKRFFKRYSPQGWLIRQAPYNAAIKLLYHRHPTEPNTYVATKTGKEPKLRGKIKRNGPRFRGRAYLVTDGGTYSSAVSVADAFQHYGMGAVVGQATGSAPNEHGEVMSLRLPNSGLVVTIPSVYYVRASGDEAATDVVRPSIEVEIGALEEMGPAELAAVVRAPRDDAPEAF